MRCLYSSKIYEQYLGIKCTHWIDQSRQEEREEGKIESDFVFIAASDAWLFKLSKILDKSTKHVFSHFRVLLLQSKYPVLHRMSTQSALYNMSHSSIHTQSCKHFCLR